MINYVRANPTFFINNLKVLSKMFKGNILQGFDNS